MIKDQDKDVLINSMKNLIKHILQGPTQQTDIFQSLSQNDFSKIVDNLNDNNKNLRKVSSLFLCEVLYDNIQNQISYCEINELPAIPGFISLNQIPTCFNLNEKMQKILFQQLKQEQTKFQDQTICWYVNVNDLNEKSMQVKVKFLKRGAFFDPADTFFGFILSEKNLNIYYQTEKRHEKSPPSIIIPKKNRQFYFKYSFNNTKININSTRNKIPYQQNDLIKIITPTNPNQDTFVANKSFININISIKFQSFIKDEKSINNNNKTTTKPVQQIFKVNNFVSQNQEHTRVRSPNAYNVRNQNTKYSIDIKMS